MANAIEKTAMVLASVGAINWGIIALTGINYVDKLLSFVPLASAGKIVYIAVGLSGAWGLYYALK